MLLACGKIVAEANLMNLSESVAAICRIGRTEPQGLLLFYRKVALLNPNVHLRRTCVLGVPKTHHLSGWYCSRSAGYTRCPLKLLGRGCLFSVSAWTYRHPPVCEAFQKCKFSMSLHSRCNRRPSARPRSGPQSVCTDKPISKHWI
jgi:hypothetical protein